MEWLEFVRLVGSIWIVKVEIDLIKKLKTSVSLVLQISGLLFWLRAFLDANSRVHGVIAQSDEIKPLELLSSRGYSAEFVSLSSDRHRPGIHLPIASIILTDERNRSEELFSFALFDGPQKECYQERSKTKEKDSA